MALIKQADRPLREPTYNTYYDKSEFHEAVEKSPEAGALYVAMAMAADSMTQFTRRSEHFCTLYPLFNEIEECEQRAVEHMTMEHYDMAKWRKPEYDGCVKYWDEVKGWAQIYIAGCNELLKDHPELTTEQAIGHCNLLFYLYGDLAPNDELLEYLYCKYCPKYTPGSHAKRKAEEKRLEAEHRAARMKRGGIWPW